MCKCTITQIIPQGDFMTTAKSSLKEDTDRIIFEVPTKLKNAFKAKASSQGKTIREVMLTFVEEYVKTKTQSPLEK